MLTTKELQYVSCWANKIPMPGMEYGLNVIKNMKECLELYKKLYQDKEYNIIFSNGEDIVFEILEKNLCHMLGIDYQNIKGEYFDNYRKNILHTTATDFTSFDLLNMLLEYADDVVKYDNDINNREKAINYYKSEIKCEIFKKLSGFDKFNFAAVNYNGLDFKYLFVPSNETKCPYFMMGIKKNNDDEKYFVSTLSAPTDPEDFFKNKEAFIPTQILIYDNNDLLKIKATPEEKIKLLTMYKSIIYQYGLENKLNIKSDYESILNDLSKNLVLKK